VSAASIRGWRRNDARDEAVQNVEERVPAGHRRTDKISLDGP
jgi:hypothetical protein